PPAPAAPAAAEEWGVPGDVAAAPLPDWAAPLPPAPAPLPPITQATPLAGTILPSEGDFAGYSIDDLAQPRGWESAGLSAVSAEDESGYIGYSPEAFEAPLPVPEDTTAQEGDVASAVFSELSSLS